MFFFTDLEKLIPQNASQAFGPVANSKDHQFLVTNKFRVKTGALAYMPVKGKICIQPANNDPNSSRVNVAIKVIGLIENGYTPVDYIVYRGILKDSIISKNLDILPAGTTDLATHLWQAWQDAQIKLGADNTTGPNPSSIGWKVLGPSDFDAELLLDDFFGDKAFGLYLPTLDEGDCIGTFDSQDDIGIDIILKDNVFVPTLNHVFIPENIVSIDVSNNSVYNQTYEVKNKRAELLAYLELGTLYMLSYEKGVDCIYNGDISTAKEVEGIYNTYLQFFFHKNTVFLDIRNDVSLSLNYYEEYKNESEDQTTTPLFYISTDEKNLQTTSAFNPTWPWPIYMIAPAASSALSLAFSVKRNNDPLAYLEFSKLSKGFEKRYGVQTSFIPLTPSNDRSMALEISLPVVKDAVTKKQVNSCIIRKLMVVQRTIKDYDPLLPNKTIGPIRQTYLDNLFGPIIDLTGKRPQRIFAKRWLNTSSTGSKGIIGAIVEPSRVYTDEHVIFQARVVDVYSSITGGVSNAASLTEFGKRIQKTPPAPQAYGPDPLDSTQEAAALGTKMRRVTLSTASMPNLPLLAWVASTNPLSLYLTRTEYDALVTVAKANYDQLLGDVYCFFSPISYEKTIDTLRPNWVFSTVIYLGGVTKGGLYVNMNESLMPINMRVYSLDGRHFNSLASGTTTTVALPPESPEEYSSNDFIADIKAIEKVYAASDVRIDQTVTRVRVHSYGFLTEEVTPTPPAPNEEDMGWLDKARDKARRMIADLKQGGRGTMFNLNIPTSDYWESDPAHPSSVPCTLKSLEVVPYSTLDSKDDNCRVRQLYATDGLPATIIKRVGKKSAPFVNKRERDITALIDPDSNIIDLSHTIYTLDSLFTAPAIMQRGFSRRPSEGFQQMNIDDAVYLANYVGDITGTLAVAYNLYYNSGAGKPHHYVNTRYSMQEFIEQQYAITTPLPDLISDADGFALYAVWVNIFREETSTKFSDVLQYYYNENSKNKEYTYKNRWKLFSLGAGFLKQNGNSYDWKPDEDKLRNVMLAGYQFGYLAEAHPEDLGKFILSGGYGAGQTYITDYYHGILDDLTYKVAPDDLTFVMRKFLDQVQALLRTEQATSSSVITYH